MDVFPRLRDTLTSGFFPAVAGHTYAWIGEEMANAKPRQECGAGPDAGPDSGRGKVAKDAKFRRRPRLRSG